MVKYWWIKFNSKPQAAVVTGSPPNLGGVPEGDRGIVGYGPNP
jgi:hypothetical protein